MFIMVYGLNNYTSASNNDAKIGFYVFWEFVALMSKTSKIRQKATSAESQGHDITNYFDPYWYSLIKPPSFRVYRESKNGGSVPG